MEHRQGQVAEDELVRKQYTSKQHEQEWSLEPEREGKFKHLNNNFNNQSLASEQTE